MKQKQQTIILLVAFALFLGCNKDNDEPAPVPKPEIIVMSLGGAEGDTISLKGKNYGADKEAVIVKFEGTRAEITALSPTEIKVIVPKGAQSGTVTVTINGAIASFPGFGVLHNRWRKKTEFPGNPKKRQGFTINGKLYVGFGESKDFWEYDPLKNKWTQKEDFPGVLRFMAVCFTLNSRGYIGTGLAYGNEARKDFWEYDPETNQWTQKKDFPGNARFGAAAYTIAGHGAFITNGGYIEKGEYYYLTDNWQYNSETDSWKKQADFNGEAGRINATAFSYGNEMAIVGTGHNNYGQQAFLQDMFKYNAVTNNWKRISNYPGGAVSSATAFCIKNNCYMGTGYLKNGKYTNSFWHLDTKTGEWSQKSDFEGVGRYFSLSFSANERGYVGMGLTYNGSGYDYHKDIWEYIP
ncbi:MAG: IPT/TIG domain-containing protein [Draconibacterium sp.]